MDELKQDFHSYLQEEHRRLNEAQAIGSIGSFEWNLGEEAVVWSDEMYRINGMVPQSRVITVDFTDTLIHPDDLPAVLALKETSFTTPGHYQLQHRIVLPTGQTKWVMHRFEGLANEKGNIVRVHGTLQDITEQVKAEQALKQSKELLQSIIDAPNLGLAVYKAVRDENGRIVDFVHEFINRTTLAALGDDFTGRLLSEHGENGSSQLSKFIEAMESGKSVTYLKHAEFGGQEHWVSFTNTPLDKDRLVHIWDDITERKKAEQEVLRLRDEMAQKAEDKYQAVFNSINEGFSLLDIQFDEKGQAYDVIIRDANPAQDRIDGLRALIGKRVREILPDIETKWIERYAAIAKSGEAASFEDWSQANQRWYKVHASRVGGENSTLVAIVYDDITERKRSEDRQSYLLKLSDAIRPIHGAVEIEETVAKVGLDHFGSDRCYYCTVEDDVITVHRDAFRGDFPSVSGTYTFHNFALFKKAMDEGRPLVVNNVHTTDVLDEGLRNICVALQIISFINVPVIKEGKPVGIFCLVQSTVRNWTNMEVELAAETAERTWAAVDRARTEQALRQSEEKYRTLFNSMDEGVATFELLYDENGKAFDMRYLATNPSLFKHTGVSADIIGRTARDFVPNLEPEWAETYAKVVETGEAVRFQQEAAGIGVWLDVYASRVGGEGSREIVVVYNNITERKLAEQRQDYLLRLSDALHSLSDPIEIEEVVTREAMHHFKANRCYYCEIKNDTAVVLRDAHTEDLPSVAAVYPLSSFAIFKAAIDAGKPFVVNDIRTTDLVDEPLKQICIGLQIFSYILVPVVKKGATVGLLCLTQTTPRQWTETEKELVVETAERTWAAVERARAEEALRKSEAELAAVFYVLPVGVGFVNCDGEIIFSNEEMKRYLPTKKIPSRDKERSERWTAHYPDGERVEEKDYPTALALRGEYVVPGIEFLYKEDNGNSIWTRVAAVPINDDKGKTIGAVCMVVDIDKLKRSEEALRLSKNRLQRMVNMPQVGVVTFDYTGKMINVNDAFLEMVGYTRDEFAVQPRIWREFTPSEYTEKSNEIMQQIRDTGRGGPYEKEYFRKDGSRIWLMFVAADLGDGTIGEYTIDINERKAAEEMLARFNEELENQVKERTEELQKNLTLLKQAEDLAGVGSWDYDMVSAQFKWSEGMYRMFELKPGTPVLPEIYFKLAIAKDKPLAAEVVHKIKTTSGPIDETICLKIGDAVRIIKVRGNAIMDEEGTPAKMVGVDMDITLSRKAEETLEQQAHFIQSTNAALPDILFVMNLNTRAITYINHSFEKKMGYTEEQRKAIREPFFSIMHEEDLPLMKAHLEEMKTAADGEIREIEYRLVAPDGSLRWFNDRDVVFKRDKSGNGIEKIGIAQEVTVRKKAEQELKETNTTLRYANENLQQFASIASHDLQEPLRKLKLFASVLRRYTESLPNEGTELVQKISLTAERMSQLIREVLQYSRIAYGAKEFVRTNLDDILKNVLGDLELLIKETGAAIEQAQPLPEIEAIPPQVNQLFYNLLTNALKFRKEGVQPFIRISVGSVPSHRAESFPELKSGKSHIEIIFEDNGIGFSQAYAEQIFQIFERLHSVEEFEGTGVGLALCKKIVENHDGHIYAVSTEGEGASFHVLLPTSQITGLK